MTPSPVRYMKKAPFCGTGLFGVFGVKSPLKNAPAPLPEAAAVNKPGTASCTVTGKLAERTLLYST